MKYGGTFASVWNRLASYWCLRKQAAVFCGISNSIAMHDHLNVRTVEASGGSRETSEYSHLLGYLNGLYSSRRNPCRRNAVLFSDVWPIVDAGGIPRTSNCAMQMAKKPRRYCTPKSSIRYVRACILLPHSSSARRLKSLSPQFFT